MLERERNVEIFYYGEEVFGFDVIPVEDLSLLREASELEKGISIQIIKNGGEDHVFKLGNEQIPIEIPSGYLLVKASTHERNLDGFWNTFDALCEFDDPQNKSLE